jgi:hypothetical protein
MHGVALHRETMADDRTIAPGPSRWHRAWQAGLRPWSPWLLPAAACGLLALAVDGSGASTAAAWLDPRPGAVAPAAWLGSLVERLVMLLAATGVAVVGLAVLSRRLGVVSTLEQRRLRAAPARPAVLARLLLCVCVGMGVVLALEGVLAGAARAVDASESGLHALWLGWAGRAGAALSLGLGLGAAVELWLDHRDRGARLWQSPEQARDEVRAAGGRSR